MKFFVMTSYLAKWPKVFRKKIIVVLFSLEKSGSTNLPILRKHYSKISAKICRTVTFLSTKRFSVNTAEYLGA